MINKSCKRHPDNGLPHNPDADAECSTRKGHSFTIQMRRLVFVNRDPQGRCYDGCLPKGLAEHWSSWEDLSDAEDQEGADRQLEYWRSLNEYAVRERGRSALKEFRIVDECNAVLDRFTNK
jgi:hypothetical protein